MIQPEKFNQRTYAICQTISRKGKPIESCVFKGGDLQSTRKFDLFGNKNLTGIISLFEKINPIFAAQNQAQIRGMAVLEPIKR